MILLRGGRDYPRSVGEFLAWFAAYTGDVRHDRRQTEPHDLTEQIPRLHLVDGHRVDLTTGEIQ